MSVLSDAIAQLQTIANSVTGIVVAPTFPIDSPAALPCAIAHPATGRAEFVNKTMTKNVVTVDVDFHFNRTNLVSAYRQIADVISEFPAKVHYNATLTGTVSAIDGSNIPYTVTPAQWDREGRVQTLMLTFSVPLKFHQTPSS